MFNPITKNLKENKSLLIITIPTMVLGCYALVNLLLNFELVFLIYFLFGYFVINIIGVTAGLHRYFSHKTYKVSAWKEIVLLYTSTLAGQGSPIWWAALHRGYHHRSSDTDKDPHSPIFGFWHSFVLWIFRIKYDSIRYRYVIDLLKNKNIVWFSTHYIKIWLLSNLFFIFISVDFFLYFSMLSSFITLVTYNITNSLNHYSNFGYTNFQTRDNSRNVPWLFFLVMGECWHNNHHGRPGSSHFGSRVSGKWWEFDPAGRIIDLIKER
jgi:fatty-acid desaturase